MTIQRIPNTRIWLQGREYLEAAEALLGTNRLPAAAILSALAIEIFLKSFLAIRDQKGNATAPTSHGFVVLFEKFKFVDATELIACLHEKEPTANLQNSLEKFDGTFTKYRYRYEAGAMYTTSSEIVYFARSLCDAVFLLGSRREV
jgi:HEPN domain-containing protein